MIIVTWSKVIPPGFIYCKQIKVSPFPSRFDYLRNNDQHVDMFSPSNAHNMMVSFGIMEISVDFGQGSSKRVDASMTSQSVLGLA